MLYLYTLMMFAWDLDKDTHAYFREYLDGFINKRKISKDLRDFVVDTRIHLMNSGVCWTSGYEKGGGWVYISVFDELRINLPYRVPTSSGRGKGKGSQPYLIEDIHPPKYYHNARKLSAPSRPNTNP